MTLDQIICLMVAGSLVVVILVVTFWLMNDNHYRKFAGFLRKRRERRKVFNDLKNEDNPARWRRQRKRQKALNNSELPLLVLLIVISGAAWFWSLIVNYNTTAHAILFLFSFMMLGIVDSPNSPNTKKT